VATNVAAENILGPLVRQVFFLNRGEDVQRELHYISQSGFIIMIALNPTITSPLISLSQRPSRS
jgi:hypothetical protein